METFQVFYCFHTRCPVNTVNSQFLESPTFLATSFDQSTQWQSQYKIIHVKANSITILHKTHIGIIISNYPYLKQTLDLAIWRTK